MGYRIDYDKVITQVRMLSNNVEEFSSQIRMLERMEQECKQYWKGQAANTFILKLSTLRNEMNRTRSQMENLTSTIRYCADKIQQEDHSTAEKAAVLKTGF